MTRPLLRLSLPLWALLPACDGVHPLFGAAPPPDAPFATPCRGLELDVLDQVVHPPANVLARLRVTTCEGAPLGRPLTADELTLSEDDVPLDELEAPRLVASVTKATRDEVLIVVDRSGSVTRGGSFDLLVGALRGLVDTLADDRRVGIVGFDGRPELRTFADFTADRATLAAAVDELARAESLDDSTNLNGAVVLGLATLDARIAALARDDGAVVQGTLVLFTDGRDRARRVSDETAAASVRKSPHAVLAIGLGAADDTPSLEALGKSGVFRADRPEGLGEAFAAAAARLRAAAETELLLGYCSPARAGTRELRVDAVTTAGVGTTALAFSAEGFGGGCAPSVAGLAPR